MNAHSVAKGSQPFIFSSSPNYQGVPGAIREQIPRVFANRARSISQFYEKLPLRPLPKEGEGLSTVGTTVGTD